MAPRQPQVQHVHRDPRASRACECRYSHSWSRRTRTHAPPICAWRWRRQHAHVRQLPAPRVRMPSHLHAQPAYTRMRTRTRTQPAEPLVMQLPLSHATARGSTGGTAATKAVAATATTNNGSDGSGSNGTAHGSVSPRIQRQTPTQAQMPTPLPTQSPETVAQALVAAVVRRTAAMALRACAAARPRRLLQSQHQLPHPPQTLRSRLSMPACMCEPTRPAEEDEHQPARIESSRPRGHTTPSVGPHVMSARPPPAGRRPWPP